MESYVERWKREQEEQKAAKQKEVQKDNGRRAEEDGQTEGKPGTESPEEQKGIKKAVLRIW